MAQSIAALASVVVAVVALIFSVVSFNRQQARAEQQQLRAEKLAIDSVKPLLWMQGRNYNNMKSIQLRNYGLGPAVIKLARFQKNQHDTNDMVELFAHLSTAVDLNIRDVSWVTFVDLPSKRVLPPNCDVTLMEQSLDNLREQGVSEQAGLELLRRIQKEKKGIKVYIEYLDTFGNEMEPVDFVFS